jgi:hypothetical protein
VVLLFGAAHTGDTRCGLVDAVGPFFGKTIIFSTKMITFLKIISKKQLVSSPHKNGPF